MATIRDISFKHPFTGARVSPDRLVAEAIKAGEVKRRGDVVDLLLDNADYASSVPEDVICAVVRAWAANCFLSVNARFWVIGPNCSPVKITLQPGCSLHHSHSYDNGEGYSRESVEWTHNGDHVTRELDTSGTDCDGRHSHSQEDYCPVSRLAKHILREQDSSWPTHWPLWNTRRASQRDYAAEAMGY